MEPPVRRILPRVQGAARKEGGRIGGLDEVAGFQGWTGRGEPAAARVWGVRAEWAISTVLETFVIFSEFEGFQFPERVANSCVRGSDRLC